MPRELLEVAGVFRQEFLESLKEGEVLLPQPSVSVMVAMLELPLGAVLEDEVDSGEDEELDIGSQLVTCK